MEKFSKEDLNFYLPDSFKGLSKKYMLDCIFNKEIQEKWYPGEGDIMVGNTGNVFTISGSHDLVDELGGEVFLFGGHLCNRDGGHICSSTACSLMNKEGFKGDFEVYDVSSFSDFRFVPYPHELANI